MGWEAWANALNLFKFCRFLRYAGNIMVAFVLAMVGFSWWMVVSYYGCLLTPGGSSGRGGGGGAAAGGALVCAAFSALVVMVVWSYMAAVVTDPGRVPEGWSPFADEQAAQQELAQLAARGYATGDKRNPWRPRYCKHCRCWKPPRAHHCSVMGRCVLNMDHYCVWVVNCVGLLNYKFFLQFLAYALVASGAGCALMAKPMLDFLRGDPATAGSAGPFIVVVMDGAFFAALIGFMGMHYSLIMHACTTIEMYEKERPSPWPYDHGFRRNWEDVMGRSKLEWLLPRHSPEERQRLLDSCLGQRLLSGGGGGGGGGDDAA